MEQGPGVRRRYLGKVLRRLREEAGLKTNQVAARMHVTQPTVSRIEGGRHAITLRNVAKMLEIYGVDGPRADSFMGIAEQANQRGWWESYGDVISDWFEIYASIEADATELWTYEAELVPGLLQTAEYIRAIRLAAHPNLTRAQLDRSVQLRLQRQEQMRGDRRIAAVIGEAVVRRVVGGRDVMRSQLRRLVDEAAGDRVDLRILPFEAGAHAAMTGAFMMLRFEDTEEMDLVYTETERGAVYLERPADLIRYGDIFTRIQSAALPPEETARCISRLVKEL